MIFTQPPPPLPDELRGKPHGPYRVAPIPPPPPEIIGGPLTGRLT